MRSLSAVINAALSHRLTARNPLPFPVRVPLPRSVAKWDAVAALPPLPTT